MDTEKLRQENRFIGLRNEGRSVEEIAELMPSISKEELMNWEVGLQKAMNTIDPDSPINSYVLEKQPNGDYFFTNELKVSMSALDGIRLQLTQLSTPPANSQLNKSQIQLSKKAAESLKIINEYLESIEFREVESGGIRGDYAIKNQTPENVKKVEDALNFYFKTIYPFQKHIQSSRLISKQTKDIYKSIELTFPVALKQFQIKNYLGIKRAGIENIPIDTPWIFITGENGYGKSTLLQAITIGLHGRKDGDIERLQDKDAFISVEFKKGNVNIINNIQDRTESLEKLACYGPSRLLIQTDRTQNEIGDRSAVTYGLFKSDGVLLNIEYELLLWYLDKDPRFEKVRQLFIRMIPYLHDIKVVDKRHVVYVEKEPQQEGEQYDALPFEKLASGFRSIIAMVGDMIVRLMKSQPYVEDPSELEGIVIIDELDLHWHPKLQRELPTLLSSAFPHVQFIATTHSVIPILGAPKNSVFLKVNRTKEEGITVQRLDLKIENLLPNILLTSPLFDMDKITAITNQDIAAVRTEDDMSELEENVSIEEHLKAFEASNRQFPDDLFQPQPSR